MATKKAPSTQKAPEAKTRVTRIRATDTNTATPAPSKKQPAVKSAPTTKRRSARGLFAPFIALGGYFKGAWQELREVRWPNRRTTWSMTGALIGFTAFFVVLILLLDALFKYVFELILK